MLEPPLHEVYIFLAVLSATLIAAASFSRSASTKANAAYTTAKQTSVTYISATPPSNYVIEYTQAVDGLDAVYLTTTQTATLPCPTSSYIRVDSDFTLTFTSASSVSACDHTHHHS